MEKRIARINFINILQVIGPVFVILGHSLNGIEIKGPWYVFSKEWIYIFHMPFFFVISGFLLSQKGWIKQQETYKQFISKKLIKLMVPYIVWNLTFFIPKYLLQSILLDDVTMSLEATIKMFFYPRQNIWGHTWFLVGLFLLYCLTPLWKRIMENRSLTYIAVFIGIVLYMIPLGTELLCISDLHKDAVFFIIGCCLGTLNMNSLKTWFKKGIVPLAILAIVNSYIALFIIDGAWFDWIPCVTIIFFIWSVSIMLENKNGFIEILAKRSFGIYILHWPVMLCVRVVFLNLLHMNTVVTIVAMIVCGYVVPNIIVTILQKIKAQPIQNVCKVLIGC